MTRSSRDGGTTSAAFPATSAAVPPDSRPPHDLNSELQREVRPDRFSMGALSLDDDPFSPDPVSTLPVSGTQPRNRFAEAYLQCNYPYRPPSRAALKWLSPGEATAKLTKDCADTMPPYCLNLFHGKKDSRVTTGTIIREMLFFIMVILTIVSIYTTIASLYQMYQAYLLAQTAAEADALSEAFIAEEAWSASA